MSIHFNGLNREFYYTSSSVTDHRCATFPANISRPFVIALQKTTLDDHLVLSLAAIDRAARVNIRHYDV